MRIRSFLIIAMLMVLHSFCYAGINVTGEVITSSFTMATGAQNGYILTSDGSGKGIWKEGADANAIGLATSTLRIDLTAETSERIVGDVAIGVDTGTLRTDLTTETNARIAADTQIGIDTGTLRTDLTTETNNRIAGDLALGVDTATLRTDVDSKVNRSGDTMTGKLTVPDLESTCGIKSSTFQMTTGATDDYILTSDVSGNASWQEETWSQYAIYEDQKNADTDAGNFNNGAWRTRKLNTDVVVVGTAISRTGNRITLTAGTYYILATAPAYRVNNHKTRFRNSTDNNDALLGTSAFSDNSNQGDVTQSIIDGVITITGTKVFKLQHRCSTTRATDGFGVAANLGGAKEVYARIRIVKIK